MTDSDKAWTAVTERLPPPNHTVLGWDCFYSRLHICIGFKNRLLPTRECDDVMITHWREFPAPPTKAEVDRVAELMP